MAKASKFKFRDLFNLFDIVVLIIALLLVSYIPDISLLIPKLCGYTPTVPMLFLK